MKREVIHRPPYTSTFTLSQAVLRLSSSLAIPKMAAAMQPDNGETEDEGDVPRKEALISASPPRSAPVSSSEDDEGSFSNTSSLLQDILNFEDCVEEEAGKSRKLNENTSVCRTAVR